MPTPSNTPPPSRLGMYSSKANRPRIKIHIPPPNLSQYGYPTFGATSPYMNTAHSNPSMQFTGAAPQWPSSPYVNPFAPTKGGIFKQFEGFKAWDWTKSGLNMGEKSVFFAYEKLSRWSKRWFTHIFLMTIVFLYSVIGAYIFVVVEGTEQENITTTFNNLKINFSKDLLHFAQVPDIRQNSTRWEEEVTKRIDLFQNDLLKMYKSGKYDIDKKYNLIYREDRQFQKTWSFWNSMFYCGTIYTTIGYGHISPATTTGRAITIVYAIIGIPLFLILLADFGKLFTRGIKFVWAYVRRLYHTGSLRRVRKQAQVQEMLRGIEMAYEIATFRRPSMMMKQSDLERAQAATPNSSNLAATNQSDPPSTPIPSEMEIDDEFNLPITLALSILITYILCGAAFYSISEKWSFFEACYFVFISMSTVGFGDFVPQHPIRMMCSIIYLIFGLALTSMCINVVQLKLTDSFRQASAKISATIGLTLAEEEARSSQNLTPAPENVSVHSDGNKNDTIKTTNPDKGIYDNSEVRDGKIITKSDGSPPIFSQRNPDQLALPPGPYDKIKSNKADEKQTRKL